MDRGYAVCVGPGDRFPCTTVARWCVMGAGAPSWDEEE